MNEEKLVEIAITAFLKEFSNDCKQILKGAVDEGRQFLETGVKAYLETQYQRFIKIKTILKGSTPVHFYDVYYPLNLRNDRHGLITSTISSTFEKSQFVTVIGDAGSGKSTLVKHLFIRAINEGKKIPIFIELRYVKSSLEDYIKEKISEGKIAENEKILDRMLQNGKFIFFFDGYDEISGENKTKLVEGINSFLEKYKHNSVLLTTRPYSDIELLPLFHNYVIESLSNENGDIDNFISLQLKDEPELSNQIKKSIKEAKAAYINSFLTNPLLLSLYILTYQSNASIPTKKHLFYRRVINALFSEHDSKSKLGFEREKKTSLQQEELEKVLKAFCFLSYFDSEYSFEQDALTSRIETVKSKLKDIKFSTNDFIHDMKVAVSLWTEDGGIISFAHRSLQEYFAALFIKDLDESNKEKVYVQVYHHSSKLARSTVEIENFLSLCEEMDDVQFYKHYYIPLLKELQSSMSGRDPLNKFLTYFCSGVAIRRTTSKNKPFNHICSVNSGVYRSIYIHLPFTLKLNRIIMKLDTSKIIAGIDLNPADKSRWTGLHFNKIKGLKGTILELLRNEESVRLSNNFIKFINTEIQKKEDFIESQRKSNSDFISMLEY